MSFAAPNQYPIDAPTQNLEAFAAYYYLCSVWYSGLSGYELPVEIHNLFNVGFHKIAHAVGGADPTEEYVSVSGYPGGYDLLAYDGERALVWFPSSERFEIVPRDQHDEAYEAASNYVHEYYEGTDIEVTDVDVDMDEEAASVSFCRAVLHQTFIDGEEVDRGEYWEHGTMRVNFERQRDGRVLVSC